nr:DUF4111 domain-containing protein [Thalassobacillus pellis]
MLSLREREENKIYQAGLRDADLAAHLTIIKNRGITLLGEPISKVFPSISPAHYLDSIMRDYNECVDNITKDPVYCTLNIIRVYCYLKEGAIFSKTEGGKWGLANLPEKFHSAIRNVLRKYQYNDTKSRLNLSGLRELRDYIQCQVEKLTENQ